MAIGINWKEIWDPVWKLVWQQSAVVPPAAEPAEPPEVGTIGSGGGTWETHRLGGIGTAVERPRRPHPEDVPEPQESQEEVEAREKALELERERLAAEALVAAEKADRELRESLTPGDAPPPPPAVRLSGRAKARGTATVRAPRLELPLKASLRARGVVTASMSPELPLRAQGIARGGAAARMSLEIEDDALALILGVPEMPSDLKEYIRLP